MEVEGLEIWNTAGLKAFVKAAAQVPPTTQAEELALVSLLKGKEAERSKAGQRLVESHQRLVIAMAALAAWLYWAVGEIDRAAPRLREGSARTPDQSPETKKR